MNTAQLTSVKNDTDEIVYATLRLSDSDRGPQLIFPAHEETPLLTAPEQFLMPRADNEDEFAQQHIELRIGDRYTYCLWQSLSDDRVRFSADGEWSAPSDTNGLPGLPEMTPEASRYQLHITANGELRGDLQVLGPVSGEPVEVSDSPNEAAFERARAEAIAEIDEIRRGQPGQRSPTQRLDAIYKELDIPRNEPDKNKTFGMSRGNKLGTDWLVQTPNCWGRAAANLPTDHSRELGSHIETMIKKAEKWVDILLLDPGPRLTRDDWFFTCLANALNHVVRQSNVTVRILLGQYPSRISGTKELLEAVLKEVGSGSGRLELHAGAVERLLVEEVCWNHSKLIAVDGKYAMVGGHNLWDRDYLRWAPVHDVSMQIEGPAAQLSHRFCDQLWKEWFEKRGSRVWRDYANTTERRVHKLPDPPPMSNMPVPGPGQGGTPILAAGCRGGIARGMSNHSTFALQLALNRAAKSIKLSQQDIRKDNFDNHQVVDALSHAILRGVRVDVVLSSDGASSGAGVSYKNGHGEARYVHAEISKRTRALASGGVDVDRLLKDNLKIAQIRFSADDVWPRGSGEFNGQQRLERRIANHAKVVIVDDLLFYIGAENLYPVIKRIAFMPIEGSLQDYGFFVEGVVETRQLLNKYWGPLWHWSSRTVL